MILKVALYELMAALKTRRALIVTLVYLAFSALGAYIYVAGIKALEDTLINAMIAQGADALSAASTISMVEEEAYQKIIAFFVGTEIERINPSLLRSPLLPPFMWGSLTFLPFLILLTGFDHVVSDVHSRSIRYSLLRVSRTELLLGKTLGQIILLASVTIISSIFLLLAAAVQLESFSIIDTAPALALAWLEIMPFGFCYVGLVTLCSSVPRQPFGALALSSAGLIGLKVMGFFAHIPSDHDLAPLYWLSYLSPSKYETGLWMADPSGPLTSTLAYVLLGAGFVMLANIFLEKRDL